MKQLVSSKARAAWRSYRCGHLSSTEWYRRRSSGTLSSISASWTTYWCTIDGTSVPQSASESGPRLPWLSSPVATSCLCHPNRLSWSSSQLGQGWGVSSQRSRRRKLSSLQWPQLHNCGQQAGARLESELVCVYGHGHRRTRSQTWGHRLSSSNRRGTFIEATGYGQSCAGGSLRGRISLRRECDT